MSYMLLILEDPQQRGIRSEAEGQAVYARMLRFGDELKARGLLVASESLGSHAAAARVEVRGGRANVLDGPFAEAKEMVGGFFLLNCASREEAVAIAGQCPAAEWATIEVRALAPCYEDAAEPG
ncbi:MULTISPECIES: YciI family protein [Polaromonas]|uniref:YciI family protein n=1 Tax=Polaromonas aquatica TaxID=332657 RepID=A0ABW1U157_9BURK